MTPVTASPPQTSPMVMGVSLRELFAPLTLFCCGEMLLYNRPRRGILTRTGTMAFAYKQSSVSGGIHSESGDDSGDKPAVVCAGLYGPMEVVRYHASARPQSIEQRVWVSSVGLYMYGLTLLTTLRRRQSCSQTRCDYATRHFKCLPTAVCIILRFQP